jgi:UDP-3-O-[3-hydroxymyristoyl] N-acetylglucosamine deacetylase
LPPHAQHTLARPAVFEGVGIHSGASVHVEVRPAEPGVGIVFLRTDIEGSGAVPARGEAVCQTRLGTVIANPDGVTVSTVEHLMAALSALAIDNAVVALDGPEVPIMDGSAQPFIEALDRAGRRPQAAERLYLEVLETVEVIEDDKRVTLSPSDRFEMAFEILFDSPAIGRQRVDLDVDELSFRRELADCRTFGFFHEVEALRAAGFARGGSLDNVVVIDNDAVLNPEGLRRPDEFVRHKALDAVGDLYLLGAPLIGRYEGLYAGHGLNNAVVRALLARPEAWRLTPAPGQMARAV